MIVCTTRISRDYAFDQLRCVSLTPCVTVVLVVVSSEHYGREEDNMLENETVRYADCKVIRLVYVDSGVVMPLSFCLSLSFWLVNFSINMHSCVLKSGSGSCKTDFFPNPKYMQFKYFENSR